jgi:predicted MFS family arabinose efflux permease
VSETTENAAHQQVDRTTTLLLTVIAALAAGSLYYVQPLLDTIAHEFTIGPTRAGLLVTGTQLGFVVGLTVGGPLGDRRSRRTLIAAMLTASAATLGLASIAPSFWLLLVAMVAIGLTAAAAQVAVPYAASLAAPERRGQVTGTVMGGVILGILLSRTASGALAGAAGWRWVFAVAATAMVLCALGTRLRLPIDAADKDPRGTLTLMASTVHLVRAEPVLRSRMLLGFFGFFGFSAMWTSLAFVLAGTYHFSDAIIGLFGLVGAMGALSAPIVGRLADRGHGVLATTAGWTLIAVGWGLLWLGASSLVALIAGLLVFDFAVQAAHISNQARVYQLDPGSRGRITTAYMGFMVTGGISGSAVSGVVYAQWAWGGVCVAGLATTALGGAWWLRHRDR